MHTELGDMLASTILITCTQGKLPAHGAAVPLLNIPNSQHVFIIWSPIFTPSSKMYIYKPQSQVFKNMLKYRCTI